MDRLNGRLSWAALFASVLVACSSDSQGSADGTAGLGAGGGSGAANDGAAATGGTASGAGGTSSAAGGLGAEGGRPANGGTASGGGTSGNCGDFDPERELCDERDGQIYSTVDIGSQRWMAENLNYASESGASCYQDKPANCSTYGRLYELDEARKVCPTGWRLPTDQDWESLAEFAASKVEDAKKSIQGSSERWTNLGEHFMSKSGWDPEDGKDTFGFNALPGGARTHVGKYFGKGSHARWWSTTEPKAAKGQAYYRSVRSGFDTFVRIYAPAPTQLSVRCIEE